MIYIKLPLATDTKVADIETSIRGVYESLIRPRKATGAVITDWRPEDPAFWQQRGQRIASRNLWISVPCLLLAFCVWMLFSAVAVNLPKVGFNFTTDQLFMLTALPSVSGALLRVPYSFMVPIFGGRRWTAFSTGILIIPCVWLGFAVQDTSTPYSSSSSSLCYAALLARTSHPVWQTSASSFRNRSRVARWV